MAEVGEALTLERRLSAPVSAVYEAITDPQKLGRWLAPGNMVAEEVIAEVRVGGTLRIAMRDPDTGNSHITNGVYHEVVPGQRLVHTWQWEDSEHETLVTIDLSALDSATTLLRLTHARFPGTGMRDQHKAGWHACIGKLSDAIGAG
ncbi:MAG: SRPBCC domain-containing protein [Gammaproteobacteria bacterium]|nr:SRPBCC domain-containing protein [Gammaproteobacteria bacterium]